MVSLVELLADLAAEGDALDAVVASLPPDAWAAGTAAPGWTIAHQVAHLAWTDDVAHLAATEPEAFRAELQRMAARPDAASVADDAAAAGAAEAPEHLLARWRAGRSRLVDALAAVPAGVKLPWFGPPMGAASMATARIMETWAHGQDVVDGLGARREPTRRLRHVADLGVRTRGFAFAVHGLPVPAPVRVELAGPGGEPWAWGPEDADERVTGSALDFCLLVTQRRHRDDLDVKADGDGAERWLGIAQVFAGPPGPGRAPGQFS